MAWNGSGTFNRTQDFTADKNAGPPDSVVSAAKMDDEFGNFKTGLQNCLTRDGQNSPTASIPMAGQKFTGLGAPSSANDSATKGYADALVTDTALGSTLNGLASVTPTTSDLILIADVSDTNIAKKVTVSDLLALTSAATGNIQDGAVTFAKIQDIATARILGRTTASSGDVEQISVSTGLTLAGGTLGVVSGSESAPGILELASAAEVATGTDSSRPAPVSLMPVTLVATGTASNSAAVEFTGLSATYTSYEFHIQDFVPASDNAEFLVQYFISGAWVTSNYVYSGTYLVAPDSPLTGFGSGGDSRILLSAATGGSGYAVSSTVNEGGVGGVVTVLNPSSSARTMMTGQVAYSSATAARGTFTNVSGTNTSTTAVTGVRFLFHTGNVASGSVKCFGRR